MRGIDDSHRTSPRTSEIRQRIGNPVGHRFDEGGMVEEWTDLVDLGSFGARLLPRVRDVLAVLTAAGIRTEGRGDERDGSLHTVSRHFADCLRKQRMPIAIAPVHGQVRPPSGQFRTQRFHQCAILVVDRALTAEGIVVLGNRKQALPRYGLAPHDVLKKRENLLAPLRPPERHQQNGVVSPRTHQLQYRNRSSLPSRPEVYSRLTDSRRDRGDSRCRRSSTGRRISSGRSSILPSRVRRATGGHPPPELHAP